MFRLYRIFDKNDWHISIQSTGSSSAHLIKSENELLIWRMHDLLSNFPVHFSIGNPLDFYLNREYLNFYFVLLLFQAH